MEIIARTTINVINHFVGLLALKSKPQELPYSMNIFTLLFILLAIITKIVLKTNLQMFGSVRPALTMFIICYESIFLSVLYFTLIRFNKRNRFIQTACNFIGINIINCLISCIINFLPSQVIAVCLTKAWILIINFHITKHAFNVKQVKAAIIYLFINITSFLITILPVMILKMLNGY